MKKLIYILLFLGAIFSLASSSFTSGIYAGIEQSRVPITQSLELSIGKSSLLKFKEAPLRVAVSNPGIVYILQISPKEWELIGRSVGKTDVYVWKDKDTVTGTEILVGLPTPPYFRSSNTMEIVNGGTSELIYIGNPSEKLNNNIPGRVSGFITDMPEPCLVPGCI